MRTPISRTPFTGDQLLLQELASVQNDVVAWWYRCVSPNPRNRCQPKVGLCFRSVDEAGSLGEMQMKQIVVSDLPIVPLGSIWRGGRRVADAVMQTKKFDVVFTPDAEFVSNAKSGFDPVVPHGEYPMKFTTDDSWMLSLPIAGGKRLLVPCLEMLARFYGRSGETVRVLTTYEWATALGRLSRVPALTPPPDGWAITPGRYIPRQDAAFVAAIRYDPVARAAAKGIHAGLATAFANKNVASIEGKKLALMVSPKIGSWFFGHATIRASGLWVDNEKSFLALRLDGMSFPQLPPITLVSYTPVRGDPEDDDDDWDGPTRRRRRDLETIPRETALTGDESPDADGLIVAIAADPFIISNAPLLIPYSLTYETNAGRRGPPRDEDPAFLSGGDPAGSGSGGAKADITSTVVLESEGPLRDMWRAMIELQRGAKAGGTDVVGPACYLPDIGFTTSVEPALITFKPPNHPWCVVRRKIFPVRGLLVARLVINGVHACLVDIERRQSLEGSHNESFCGLVFREPEPAAMSAWVTRLINDTPSINGVISRLASSCPTPAFTFKHTKSAKDTHPAQTALRSALAKIGVET